MASVAADDRNNTVQPEKTLLKSARALSLGLRPAPATAGAPPAFLWADYQTFTEVTYSAQEESRAYSHKLRRITFKTLCIIQTFKKIL